MNARNCLKPVWYNNSWGLSCVNSVISLFYLNRSHFSMKTTINQVNPAWKVKSSRIKFTAQLTWTPFSKLWVDILWKFSSSFQCKIDDSVSYSHLKICLFSIQKSYFSIEKMISATHWQLITSNLCLTHTHIGDNYTWSFENQVRAALNSRCV